MYSKYFIVILKINIKIEANLAKVMKQTSNVNVLKIGFFHYAMFDHHLAH